MVSTSVRSCPSRVPFSSPQRLPPDPLLAGAYTVPPSTRRPPPPAAGAALRRGARAPPPPLPLLRLHPPLPLPPPAAPLTSSLPNRAGTPRLRPPKAPAPSLLEPLLLAVAAVHRRSSALQHSAPPLVCSRLRRPNSPTPLVICPRSAPHSALPWTSSPPHRIQAALRLKGGKKARDGGGSGIKRSSSSSAAFLTASTTTLLHTISESEKASYVGHINAYLAEDPFLKNALPVDPATDHLFHLTKDGVLLCKLINLAVPGTIDERAINTKRLLNLWEKNENHMLCLNSAKAIGCTVVNIGTQDLAEGRLCEGLKHMHSFVTWMLQPQPAMRPHINDISFTLLSRYLF